MSPVRNNHENVLIRLLYILELIMKFTIFNKMKIMLGNF